MSAGRFIKVRLRPVGLWIVILMPAIMLVNLSDAAGASDELIAHFLLNESAADATGKNKPPKLENAPFVNGALFLNGVYHGSAQAAQSTAIFPVRNLDYGSYTVAVDFRPSGFAPERKWGRMHQWVDALTFGQFGRFFGPKRSDNTTIFTGGMSYRWLGFRVVNHTLELTLNNQETVHTFTGSKVKLNRWHHLICSFDLSGRKIITMLDGQLLETIVLPEDFRLQIIGSEGQPYDNNFTFANYSIGSAYYGHAANLKVFGRALNESEIAAIYTAAAGERAVLTDPPAASPFLGIAGGGTVMVLLLLVVRAIQKCRQPVSAGGKLPTSHHHNWTNSNV